MSATAAHAHQPQLAYSNAVGGIAAQTAALVVADLFHRGANLEHAAASLPNMMSAILLAALLLLAVLASFAPDIELLGMHPASLILLVGYIYGVRVVRETSARPLWVPRRTRFTVLDEPSSVPSSRSTRSLWVDFLVVGALISAGGWAIARAAESFVVRGGVEASLAGAVLMGVVNAMPETVTSIAAVRRGALTLAVAGVLGGNAFDVLNLVVADATFRGGSIYHVAGRDDVTLALTSTLMTIVLLGGLLRRQARGVGKIGTEGALALLLYAAGLLAVTLPD